MHEMQILKVFDIELFRLNSLGKAPVSITDFAGLLKTIPKKTKNNKLLVFSTVNKNKGLPGLAHLLSFTFACTLICSEQEATRTSAGDTSVFLDTGITTSWAITLI